MEVNVDKTGPCECEMSIVVPAEDVSQAFQKAYRDAAKRADIPGFRKGKVPKHVIKMHYGPQVSDDVEQKLVQSSLQKALVDNDVSPAAMPVIDAGELKEGHHFSYKATLETQPVIELSKVKGLEVSYSSSSFDTTLVDKECEKLREQAAQIVPVTIRDTVEDGDLVLVDFVGSQGGVALEGATAEGTLLEVGKDEYLPGASDLLRGAQVPGKVSLPVDFADDHPIPQWQGKSMTFEIQLREIKVKELPELDDEFAKDLGEESLADLRSSISKKLEDEHNAEEEKLRRKALLESLVDANPFALPPSMIKSEAERMVTDAASRVSEMMGDRFSTDELDMDSLCKDNLPQAEQQVRSGLLLLEVSKAESVTVADKEIDAKIDDMAAEAGEYAPRLRSHYADHTQRDRLRYRILEDKTVETLLENATVTKLDSPSGDKATV
jgi:trigger factor